MGFVHEWCHDVVLLQLDFIGFRKLLIEIESLEHSYNIQQMSIVMVKMYSDSLAPPAGGAGDATPVLEAALSR